MKIDSINNSSKNLLPRHINRILSSCFGGIGFSRLSSDTCAASQVFNMCIPVFFLFCIFLSNNSLFCHLSYLASVCNFYWNLNNICINFSNRVLSQNKKTLIKWKEFEISFRNLKKLFLVGSTRSFSMEDIICATSIVITTGNSCMELCVQSKYVSVLWEIWLLRVKVYFNSMSIWWQHQFNYWCIICQVWYPNVPTSSMVLICSYHSRQIAPLLWKEII